MITPRDTSSTRCTCQNGPGICLGTRQTGRLGVGALFCVLGSFALGYFWGRRAGVEEFLTKSEQNTFADCMYTSLCTRASEQISDEPTEDDAVDEQEAVVVATQEEPVSVQPDPEPAGPRYAAHLIGFGTEAAAQKFIRTLREHDIATVLRTRTSTTRAGKKVPWYQVVTAPFASQDLLSAHVEDIRQYVTLRDVRIVEQTITS